MKCIKFCFDEYRKITNNISALLQQNKATVPSLSFETGFNILKDAELSTGDFSFILQ